MSDGNAPPRFESVDWDEIDRSRRIGTAERVTALVGFAAVGVLYLYDRYVVHVYLVSDWRIDLLDWVFLLSLVVILAYGVVPAYRRRESVSRTFQQLRTKPAVLLGLGYLSLVAFFGLFGPLFTPGTSMQIYQFNPPMGLTSEVHTRCAGVTSGGAFDEVCRGSWEFPLGTNRRGERVESLILAGTRPAVYVVVIGAVLVLPLATAVGVIAGLRGGVVDRLLMSYVDLQLSVPAIIIYFVAYMYYGPSLLLLLVAFGLFSWGGLARLVRSEVIQCRERGHVTIARSLGASESYVARRHVVPNVTNTLVPAACQLLALLVLYEAGVAFLGFHEATLQSWGATISGSISAEIPGQHQTRTDVPAYQIWWVSTFPALALTLTMVSFKLVGDGVRDALDPRGGRE